MCTKLTQGVSTVRAVGAGFIVSEAARITVIVFWLVFLIDFTVLSYSCHLFLLLLLLQISAAASISQDG